MVKYKQSHPITTPVGDYKYSSELTAVNSIQNKAEIQDLWNLNSKNKCLATIPLTKQALNPEYQWLNKILTINTQKRAKNSTKFTRDGENGEN